MYQYLPRACPQLPKCKEKDKEEVLPIQPRVWIGSTSRCNGCVGINATFDPSLCLPCGSALSPLLVAISSDVSPVLMSWHNCIALPSEIIAPRDASSGVLLLQDISPLPILGQVPSNFCKNNCKLLALTCSVLVVQRAEFEESFELFFLFWDEECGYSYVNSGKLWIRNQQRLESVGNSRLTMILERCRRLETRESKIIGTPWQAMFKLKLSTKNLSECSSLSASESVLLKEWLRG